MVTAQELKDKYKKDLKKLQDNCKHEDVSDWIQEYWAPGHMSDFEVKICNICEKTVSKRTICDECMMIIVDDEIHYGDGKKLALNSHWCKDCYESLINE